MINWGFWELVAASGSAGACFGFAFLTIRWLATFIAGRMDKKEDRLDRSTALLLDRLEGQVASLTKRVEKAEAALAECKEQHAESSARVLHLEAILQGQGDARQIAQLIIADEKKGGA